jgi:hypothetical protein
MFDTGSTLTNRAGLRFVTPATALLVAVTLVAGCGSSPTTRTTTTEQTTTQPAVAMAPPPGSTVTTVTRTQQAP